MTTRIKIDPFLPPFLVAPSDAFKKGAQKMSLLNLSKRDDIICANFLKHIVATKFESQLADFLIAAFPKPGIKWIGRLLQKLHEWSDNSNS